MNQKLLLIEHQGWEVTVSSWTVAAKPGDRISLCYMWAYPASGGVAVTELNLTMNQFLETVRAAEGPIVDLRELSR